MRFLLICFILSTTPLLFAQHKKDSVIRFERYHSGKIKKIKQGKEVIVFLNDPLGRHIQQGNLAGLTETSLIIDMTSEKINHNKDSVKLNESNSFSARRTEIPISSIAYLNVHRDIREIGPVLTMTGFMIATIVAPLAAIDHDKDHHFNTKNYSSWVMQGFMIAAEGIIFHLATGNDSRYKFKVVAPSQLAK